MVPFCDMGSPGGSADREALEPTLLDEEQTAAPEAVGDTPDDLVAQEPPLVVPEAADPAAPGAGGEIDSLAGRAA